MGHTFTAVRTAVDHNAEPIGEVQFFGHVAGGEHEMTENGSLIIGGFPQTRDGNLRNHEKVHGCLRLNVSNHDTGIILVFDFRWNFTINNLLK